MRIVCISLAILLAACGRETAESHRTAGDVTPALAPSSLTLADPTYGSLDDVSYGYVRGWARDPAHPDNVINADVYVDGVAVQRITANIVRPDLPGSTNHGFAYKVPSSLRTGTHLVRVAAIAGTNPDVGGGKSYTVPNATIGFVDSVQGNVVSGWALDPVGDATSINVDLYLDGPVGTQGVFSQRVTANLARPDVNTATGATGAHGFSFTLPAGERHSLYVYGLAVTSGLDNGRLINSATEIAGTAQHFAGFDTTYTHRLAAAYRPDKAYYAEACPDGPGGVCSPTLPVQGGFYDIANDLGGNFQACTINHFTDWFDFGGTLGSQHGCPFSFAWLSGAGQPIAAELAVSNPAWTTDITPNIYLGLQHSPADGVNYIGGSNFFTTTSAYQEFTLTRPQSRAFGVGGRARVLAGATFFIPKADLDGVNDYAAAVEINLDRLYPTSGDDTPEWSLTTQFARDVTTGPQRLLYLGGAAWGFDPIGTGKTYLIPWKAIFKRLVALNKLPAQALAKPYVVGYYIGTEMLGRAESRIQISALKTWNQ